MPRVTGHNAITVGIVSILSIYMGVNFFQPIVVERLREDGNLRQDRELPHFNQDGSLREDGLPWKVQPSNTPQAEKQPAKNDADPFDQ